jgi:hypothetical protein
MEVGAPPKGTKGYLNVADVFPKPDLLNNYGPGRCLSYGPSFGRFDGYSSESFRDLNESSSESDSSSSDDDISELRIESSSSSP